MAKLTLAPLTALGHALPEQHSIGPVTLTENPGVALASVAIRAGRGADVAAAAAAAGIPLPGPGRAEPGAPYGAFWMTPEMWMIEAPFASHEDIRRHLLAIFGDAASITEQTDGWVVIEVTGQRLPDLFERLCNVDLRAAVPGHATRTVIDHIGCYLILRDAGRITVMGPRSSAAALWHALEGAALSVF